MNEQPETVEVEQPPITHKQQGLPPFSMIDGLLAFQPDEYYVAAFNDSVRVSKIRDRMVATAETVAEREAPPAAAYREPQGERVNPNPAPSTPPIQQPPPAAQGRAQNGQQQWPPHVVEAVTDEGERVPGCSWHSKSDKTPRPMRYFETWGRPPQPFNAWKCTGQTGKTDDGYCSLIHRPETVPAF